MDNNNNTFGPNVGQLLDFGYESSSTSIIKVIGVGGGGGNAVNHMYNEGIHDVSFALCNTDNQALDKSLIPKKIQLGKTTTQGLGAGNKPTVAKDAAEESIEEIHELFNDGTRMVFITAGMGGGTGTGAAPIIAREAKKSGILTVGIVTIPFLFEGQKKIDQAISGVEEMSKNVDALLVINNERLCSIYPDLTFFNAFAKADDTLTVAAKSIAEIITTQGHINLDFNDVQTILKDGGIAIMSSGLGEGPQRVTQAIDKALNSPLLNNTEVYNAQKVLFNIYFSEEHAATMAEMKEISEFMGKFDNKIEVIWGAAVDNTLGEQVKMTLLATGFNMSFDTDAPASAPARTNTDTPAQAKPIDMTPEKATIEKVAKIYGEDIAEDMKTTQARAAYYIFSMDDIDNDQIIEVVEKTPAYNRDKNFVRGLQNQMKQTTEKVIPTNNTPPAKPTSTIQF